MSINKEKIMNEGFERIQGIYPSINERLSSGIAAGDIRYIEGRRHTVKPMRVNLKLTKGGLWACPHCQGKVQVHGDDGAGACPLCGEISALGYDGELHKVAGIKAALDDGLGPLARRIAKAMGNDLADVRKQART